MLPTVHTCNLSGEMQHSGILRPVTHVAHCTYLIHLIVAHPRMWATLGSHIHVLGYFADKTENEKKVISTAVSEPACDRHWPCGVLHRLPQNSYLPVVLKDNRVLARDGVLCNTFMYIPECNQHLELLLFIYKGHSSPPPPPPVVTSSYMLFIVDGIVASMEFLSVSWRNVATTSLIL